MGAGAGHILAKGLGVATIIAVGFDVNKYAKHTAAATERNHKSETLKNMGLSEIKDASSSSIETSVRKGIYKMAMDEKVTKPFTTTSGYLQGVGTMVVNHALPLALALGTFMGKGWFLSKTCGVGLLAYGTYFLAKEVFKIGGVKEEK